MTHSPYEHDLLKIMDKKMCDGCGHEATHKCEEHVKFFCIPCGHAHLLMHHTKLG